MKVELKSAWNHGKHRPNIWLNLMAENDTEKALLLSLYGVKPKFVPSQDGQHMIDFYPEGEKDAR